MADIVETRPHRPWSLEDDARVIEEILRDLGPLPEGMHRVDYELGEDSVGDPAVWLLISADDDWKPSEKKIEDYYRFRRDLEMRVLMSGINRFPFTRIV